MYRVYHYGYQLINGEWVQHRVPFCTHKSWKTTRGPSNYIAERLRIDALCCEQNKSFHDMMEYPGPNFWIGHDDEKIEHCGSVYEG
jgi:hypothetical protein